MSPLSVQSYSDTAAFAAAAEPFLLRAEASNCLQLGLIDGIRSGEWKEPLMVVASRDGELDLVAIRTPPHNLSLSTCDRTKALPLLVDCLLQAPSVGRLPGVLGPAEVADSFAELWSSATGVRALLAHRQRIYRLDGVEPVKGVNGTFRLANGADAPLLAGWIEGFFREALPHKPFDARATAERWLSSSGRELFLWELGGRPVAMAGAAGRTPNGIRIGAVYTPPECRRRGYASALVAALSQRQLDAGRKFCFLFTDLANPTSNHIYQQLGYVPVSDANEYRFEAD
jgi:predicted GNAT family acetyltransferase